MLKWLREPLIHFLLLGALIFIGYQQFGRGESDAASLLAAGRHVESATQQIEALARERQLALLSYLSPLARGAVESFVESGRSALVEELRAEWVGDRVAA